MTDNTILIFRAPAGSFVEMPENVSRKYWEIRLTAESGQFEVLLVSDEQDVIGDVIELLDDPSSSLGGVNTRLHNTGNQTKLYPNAQPTPPRSLHYEQPMTPEPPNVSDPSNFPNQHHSDHRPLTTFQRHPPTTNSFDIGHHSTSLFGSPRGPTTTGSGLSRDAFQRLELPTATPYILTGVDEPLSFLSAHDMFVEGNETHELQPEDCSLSSHKSSSSLGTGLPNRSTNEPVYYQRVASSSTTTASDYSSYF